MLGTTLRNFPMNYSKGIAEITTQITSPLFLFYETEKRKRSFPPFLSSQKRGGVQGATPLRKLSITYLRGLCGRPLFAPSIFKQKNAVPFGTAFLFILRFLFQLLQLRRRFQALPRLPRFAPQALPREVPFRFPLRTAVRFPQPRRYRHAPPS